LPTNAIEVSGLTKRYGELVAVDGIDFSVASGEVVAILGPNGAGKSTTIEILEGFRGRDGGEVEVLGSDPEDADRTLRDRIGIVLQTSGFDRELTVRETLRLFSRPYRSPRSVDEVMDLVDITDKADERLKGLSGGQQRRVDVGLGLLGNPELLFLDEPTTGFDPAARRSAWEMLARLTEGGTTIVLTTHYMEEADYLADRIIVLASGRIVADATPDTIIGPQTRTPVVSFSAEGIDTATMPPDLAARTEFRDSRLHMATEDPTRDLHALTTWALEQGLRIDTLEVRRPSLEDVYLDLLDSQR
jgi:ABC-2 type transport system ATP-binding protein